MGKPSVHVSSPSVASTMRSAVTTLLSFVALPVIPLSSTLDTLIELVGEIVEISGTSRRQVLMDFGQHVSRVVNQLVSALRNEQISRQPNVRKNLEELQRTLDKILRNLCYINGSGSLLSRLGRALFPQEDQMQVARMRQQLDDALNLFHFAAACELLSRTQDKPHIQAAYDEPMPTPRHHTQSSSNITTHDLSQCQEHPNIRPESAQAHWQDPRQPIQRARPRALAFIAAGPPNLGRDEVADAYTEVNSLRRSFYRSRRPLPAMELAVALSRYSDLLVKSGRTAEALAASQESARMFKSLAERGSEIYFDFD
ncbi:hypothetical protein V565_130930 [Rhizoctonia solani 123E]|uniref:Uncharacterized protein n=1 Tax=Rhizoctonia solani 123E TaxID=1423351 RepID=A0A074SDV7_9AGAM|nr:hypothetical protein V565_130930 [Rhizoctonia solani 123E]